MIAFLIVTQMSNLFLSLNGPLIVEKVFHDEIDIIQNITMLLYLGNKHS